MNKVPRAGIALLWLLAAWPAALFSADYLFVFHEGSTVTVYNPETMEIVGLPQVGPGARKAIGVPDPANPANLLKIYVIADDTVHALDPAPPFDVRRSWPLRAIVTGGEQGAQLTPDGKYLLVLANEFLFAFDALAPDNQGPSLVPFGGLPLSLAVRPDSRRAYVAVEGSLALATLNLQVFPPQRLEGPVQLPALPSVVGAAPNSAGIFTAHPGGLVEIDPYRNVVVRDLATASGTPLAVEFDREAPLDELLVVSNTSVNIANIDFFTVSSTVGAPAPISKAGSPGGNLVYLLSPPARQIFRATRDGLAIDGLRNPDTGLPFPLPAVDFEISANRQRLYAAFGEAGLIARLTATASALEATRTPPLPPTGISLVEPPGTTTASLLAYGGAGQAGIIGEVLPRPISVLAVDNRGRGVADEEISFVSFTPGVNIQPNRIRTNFLGEARVEVTPPSTEVFEIEARTSSGLSVRFELNTGEVGAGGLTVLTGDFQIALENNSFPRETGIKIASTAAEIPPTTVTISPRQPNVVCPATVQTDGQGRASFQCTAGSAGSVFPRVIRVDVTDEFGRRTPEPLTFTIVASTDDLPRDPLFEKPQQPGIEILGQAGEMFEDTIRQRLIRNSGLDSVREVGFEFEDSRNEIVFTPRIAPTGDDGRMSAALTFGCRLGQGTITVTTNSPGLPETAFDYRVTTGPPRALARLQGSGQMGEANQRLDGPNQALVVRVTDGCGNPVANTPLEWEVNPPDAASLENVSGASNNSGRGSAVVRLGSRPGAFSVIARGGGGTAIFDLLVNVTPTRLQISGGDRQQVSVGSFAASPVSVDLLNDLGAGAPGEPVTFRVTSGQASFDGPATVLTDAQGRASIRVRAGASIGPIEIEASALDFTAVFRLDAVGRAPVVSSAGFVNAASFEMGLVPGSAASIFGSGLMEGIDGIVAASGPPFPTRLRGVRVIVDGVEAPILALVKQEGRDEQINIQVPFFANAPSDNVSITIENNGVSATFTNARTLVVQPGIFPVHLPGGVFAAALHADGSLVEPTNPAQAGEVIQLFWTGGGPVEPPIPTNAGGPASPLSATVNSPAVILDGKELEVQVSVLAPTLLTVYQVNVVVEADRSGSLPLTIRVLDRTSPEIMLPVSVQ